MNGPAVAFALAYLIAINLAAFGAFALDKRRAVLRLRRVRERTLLALAAIGGTPGAIAAQRLLRHKTRKRPFGTYLGFIAAAQALVAAAVFLMR